MSRRLQVPLYLVFAVFALGGSFLLTFPYDTLGRRLEAEVGKNLPGATLAINEIGPALPFGVRMANVVFARDGKDGAPGPKITIDRIRVRPALWSLLTGKAGLSYTIDILAGTVHGQVVVGKDGARVEAVLEGLQLDEGKTLENATGLVLAGGMSGRVDLTLDLKGQVTDGSIAATVAGGKVKSGKVMGFSVPAVDLGSPEVNITLEKGEAKIVKADMRSPDLEVSATGSSTLRADLANSPLKGTAKIRLTDGFLSRNPDIKAMIGFAGAFKKPDGSLEVPINGTLARPVSLPSFGGRF